MRRLHYSHDRDAGSIPCDCAVGVDHEAGEGLSSSQPVSSNIFDALFPALAVRRGGIKFLPPAPPPAPEKYPPVVRQPVYDQNGNYVGHESSTGGWCAPTSFSYATVMVTGDVHPDWEEEDGMSFKERRQQDLLNMMVTLQTQIAALDKFPDVDEYPDNTVLKIVVGTKHELTYILFKVVPPPHESSTPRWYHTGTVRRSISKPDGHFAGWDQVTQWLSSVSVVSVEEMVVKTATAEPPSQPVDNEPAVTFTDPPAFNLSALTEAETRKYDSEPPF